MTEASETADSLPPYSGENTACAKCGCVGATTTHRKQGDQRAGDFFAVPPAARVERLERRCPRCRFIWDEALTPAAPAAPAPAADQAAVRDRIAEALYEHERPAGTRAWGDALAMTRAVVEARADAVLAVLPAPADRATVLREAADEAERVAESLRAHHEFERSTGALDVMTELRRLAAEARGAQQDQAHACRNCSGIDPDSCLMNPNRPD